jgi:hypothetical protein
MSQPTRFRYIKLSGSKLSPESFGNKEPGVSEVYEYVRKEKVKIKQQDMVPVTLVDGVHWLSIETYNYAKKVLAENGRGKSPYEAHEGVSFDVAKGAWLIIESPQSTEPPIGAPKDEKYVRVKTKLSEELGLEPFVVEERFMFKCFKGEDVGIGRVRNYRYFLAAYKRDGTQLTEEKLEQTFLWKKYLSNSQVREILEKNVSRHMKKGPWYIERMGKNALAQYKVVWRDVAEEFIPAVDTEGAVPDHNVHYVIVSSLDEAYYLMAVLLAPQINAVVRELSPWIGHVQPRFIKYFKIPKYDPNNNIHKQLVEIGKEIYNRGDVTEEERKKVEKLVEKLCT